MLFGGVEVGILELVANISRTHKVKLFVCKFWEFKRLVIHHKHGQFWHFLMKWAKNKYTQHNMQNNNSWIQKFATRLGRVEPAGQPPGMSAQTGPDQDFDPYGPARVHPRRGSRKLCHWVKFPWTFPCILRKIFCHK